MNTGAKGRGMSGTTIWTPAFISLFGINIIIQMGQYMMNTLVPVFAKELGATPSVIGFVSSIFGITALAMSPIAGPSYDSFSRKRLLTLFTGICTAVFIAYSFAGNITVVLVARVFHGVSAGCVIPLCLLLASDALPEDKMTSGIGTFSVAQCIASAIGPGAGLALAGRVGYSSAFRVGAVCMGIAFLMTFIIHENTEREKKPFRISLASMMSKRALIPGGIMFFIGFAYTCINSFLVVYAAEYDVANIAVYFTIYAIGLMIVQPISGRMADHFGITLVILLGTIVYMANFFVLSIASSLPMFIASAVLSAIGYGALHPTMQSLTIQCAEDGRRGAASNTYYICMNLSMFVGPVVAGWMVSALQNSGRTLGAGYALMFRANILVVAGALVYYLVTKKWIPKNVKL